MNNKIYSILIVANYKNSSTTSRKWITMLDSIKNNLLGTEHTPESMWVPFKNMPPIRVSIVDIVESIDEAIAYFDTTLVDVVLVEDEINGTRIGIGSLNKMKKKNPSAIYIMMLGWNKKKGVSYPVEGPSGTVIGTEVCDGRKVQSLYDNGYYNAIYKKGFDIHLLIDEIQSGGMSAQWAATYYGLDNDMEKTISSNTTTHTMREEQEMFGFGKKKKHVAEQDATQPAHATAYQLENESGKITSNRMNDDDYSFEEEDANDNLDEEYIQIDSSYDDEADYEQSAYLKKQSSINSTEPIVEAEVLEDDTQPEGDFSYLPAHINNGKTCVRYCMAHVSFIQGDTIILKADQKLSSRGMGYENLVDIDTPVAIPYIVNK